MEILNEIRWESIFHNTYKTLEVQKHDSPEQIFWIAIIMQAVDDLFFVPNLTHKNTPYAISKKGQAWKIRRSAYNLLFASTPHISRYRRLVFENAGPGILEMDELRQKADKFEAENT